MTDVDTLTLPALSNEAWCTLCTAFGGPVRIPEGDAWSTMITGIVADHALDELPEGHPLRAAVLAPFWDLSEAEAYAALSVNNVVWHSGRFPWL